MSNTLRDTLRDTLGIILGAALESRMNVQMCEEIRIPLVRLKHRIRRPVPAKRLLNLGEACRTAFGQMQLFQEIAYSPVAIVAAGHPFPQHIFLR